LSAAPVIAQWINDASRSGYVVVGPDHESERLVSEVVATKNSESHEKSRVFWIHGHSVLGMLQHVRSIVAAVARRFRSRAVLELENLASVISCMFYVANGRVGPD
jgi:hypothetical protein